MLMTTPMTAKGAAPKRRVLVVEDDLCLKTMLLKILSQIDEDTQCDWVTTVDEALALLRDEEFDLVISDYHLESHRNGMELWRECHRKYPELKFLMMSGIGVEKFLTLSRSQHKAPLFLPKPFRVVECANYLKSLMSEGPLV